MSLIVTGLVCGLKLHLVPHKFSGSFNSNEQQSGHDVQLHSQWGRFHILGPVLLKSGRDQRVQIGVCARQFSFSIDACSFL